MSFVHQRKVFLPYAVAEMDKLPRYVSRGWFVAKVFGKRSYTTPCRSEATKQEVINRVYEDSQKLVKAIRETNWP